MDLILRVGMREQIGDDRTTRWMSRWLEVVPRGMPQSIAHASSCQPEFYLMCSAIMSDIQSAAGSGATALAEIRDVESGNADHIESDGNAWVAHVTRDRVWFEGLYEQKEGGSVTFAQYKLAVETYVRFLADPYLSPVEVPFPP